jgi:hypothetical protein
VISSSFSKFIGFRVIAAAPNKHFIVSLKY